MSDPVTVRILRRDDGAVFTWTEALAKRSDMTEDKIVKGEPVDERKAPSKVDPPDIKDTEILAPMPKPEPVKPNAPTEPIKMVDPGEETKVKDAPAEDTKKNLKPKRSEAEMKKQVTAALKTDHGYGQLEYKAELVMYAEMKLGLALRMKLTEDKMRAKLAEVETAFLAEK